MRRVFDIAAYMILALPAFGQDLRPVGGTEKGRLESPADSVRLPRAAWQPGTVFSETEGFVRRTVYTLPDSSLTSLQVIDPLRTELLGLGYQEVFTCTDAACGGFDFRFQLDLLPAPIMHVDLGNYRYLLMEKLGSSPEQVALVASGTSTGNFLHITEVSKAVLPELKTTETVVQEPVAEQNNLIAGLIANGRATLSDLEFSPGSANLGPGPFASLETLRDWLAERPEARIVLVGHSDAVGALDANQSLSQLRAASVLRRLIEDLGVPLTQVQAQGAGSLSPVASNLTSEGRAKNRRVEVVLLSLE